MNYGLFYEYSKFIIDSIVCATKEKTVDDFFINIVREFQNERAIPYFPCEDDFNAIKNRLVGSNLKVSVIYIDNITVKNANPLELVEHMSKRCMIIIDYKDLEKITNWIDELRNYGFVILGYGDDFIFLGR